MASKNGKVNITLGTHYSGYGITAALKGLKSLSKGATDIKSAFEMGFGAVQSIVSKLGGVLASAFKFETQTTQFKNLIGSIDAAKEHMADLKALGDTPPFSLDEFAKASKELLVMSDGVLGYKQSLEMLGDAAAATGRPIDEMSHAVGKLFSTIRDGQPIASATRALKNMGVITPEVEQKLKDLQDAGASGAEIWAEVEKSLQRYSGAMKESEQTGEGLMAAIKTRWDNIVRRLGEAFAVTAKDGMGDLLTQMTKLEESDAIGEYADKTVEKLGEVAEAAKSTASAFAAMGNVAWTALKATLGTAMAFAAGMDEAGKNGEGWFNFSHGAAVAGEYWRREVRGERDPEEVAREEEARAERRAKREKLRAERKAREEQRAIEETSRIKEALEEGDRKKAAKEAEKAAVEAQKAEVKAAQDYAKEREKLDRELHQKRMDQLRKEIDAQENAASALKSTAQTAQSEFDKAFAMYRDPSRAASEIAEEQDYRNDLEQLHKDARRYGGKWRIDQLSSLMAAGDTQGVSDTLAEWRKSRGFSPQVEAMVRASAAEQAKNSLEDTVKQIEQNTADLAAKVDELLQVKG